MTQPKDHLRLPLAASSLSGSRLNSRSASADRGFYSSLPGMFSRCSGDTAALATPGRRGIYSPVLAVIDVDPIEVLRQDCVAAQTSYDATHSHKALVRLRDAKHALLAAEVRHA